MSRIAAAFPVLVLILAASLSNRAVAGVTDFEGTWVYSSYNNLMSDTMVVEFTIVDDGTYDARLIVPEVRVDVQLPDVTALGDTIWINNEGRTLFEATISADGMLLDGQLWTGSAIPMTLMRAANPLTFNRPQDPAGPFPYTAEQITFRSGEINLSGTLTLPQSDRPVPAVVLLSGSGADERDYLVGGHYPFWVIADYLTRLGIAVLRFDDRGVGASEGESSSATTHDLAVDALSAIGYLQLRPEIDPQQIGIIGHSDGAGGAALAAAASSNVAFIVMLGGLGVTGEEHLLLQAATTWQALGASDARIAWQVEVQQGLIDILKSDNDPATLQARLDAWVNEINANLTPERRQELGLPLEGPALTSIVGRVAWLQYLLGYDPREALLMVDCPVLALNGDLDAIVSSTENLAAIERALADGGNPDFKVLELPGLNHFFQTCELGAPAEYVWLEETFSPAALDLLGEWIVARTGAEPVQSVPLFEPNSTHLLDGARFLSL